MQQIVLPDDVRVRIGQNRKRQMQFLPMPLARLRLINRYCRDANAAPVKIGQSVLEAPQLGAAERSPKSAIENEQRKPGLTVRTVRGNQICQPDEFPILIWQPKIVCLLADLRRSG